MPEIMFRNLPRTEEQHQAWLRFCGLVPVSYPLETLKPFVGRVYQPTQRYVLQTVLMPNRLQATNVITDGNLWAVPTEFGGLFDFILLRAVALAAYYGVPPDQAKARLFLQDRKTPDNSRRYAEWAIGYERGTGLCTILEVNRGETKRHFLEGSGGYFTPWSTPQ